MAEKAKSEGDKDQTTPSEKDLADEKAGEEMMEKILKAMGSGETPNVGTNSFEAKEKEYQDKIARQQADFDNFRKRTDKDRIEYLHRANANLISELLPALDHFELALKHNKDKGVALIYDELIKILEKQGVKVVETKGIFDPKIHEVVLTVAGDKDGEILEEIQKGYSLNEKLLRAAKVKISKVKEK